jgi:hypothetical protein
LRAKASSTLRIAFPPRRLASAAVALSIACAALGLPAEKKTSGPKNLVAALSDMLLGTFRGSGPGNELMIVSTRVPGTPTSQLDRLDVRVTGRYQGDAVVLRGLWRISYQGDQVWLVFIPGVDPTEAARRFSSPAFSPTEMAVGCWTILSPVGNGFEGTVRPFPDCRNAVQARAIQSVEKEWSLRFGQDGMRFENAQTGEVLAFTRAPKE